MKIWIYSGEDAACKSALSEGGIEQDDEDCAGQAVACSGDISREWLMPEDLPLIEPSDRSREACDQPDRPMRAEHPNATANSENRFSASKLARVE